MTSDPYTEFELALGNSGLHGGIAFLNARVPHRFTAIYRLDGMVLEAVDMVDKDGEMFSSTLQAVPLGDSFCQFTMREGHFITQGSGKDTRLAGHPYQGVVESYVGLPLTRGSGELYGTLCHYDFAECPVSDEEYAFLTRAAKLLPRFL